jgi:hypothetical protein
MAELKPLTLIQGTQVQEKKEAEKPIIEQTTEKVEISNDLLKKVNGELCFELQFGSKTLVVSESKCSQLIPEFKKMSVEQKETFLMQAAIFGANPFSLPPEIYPVPFTSQNVTTYAPVISAKKYVEKGMQNPKFDGMKSGIVVEKTDGSFDFRKGQIYNGKSEKLTGGWAEIFIKGMREPIFRSVNLNEVMNFKGDGTPNKFWKEKPALMVEKVAQKQAMEIAMQMPKTYIEEEIALDIEHEDVSNQKAISASNDEFFNK